MSWRDSKDSTASCMRNGWLLKRGEVVKGWKKRWFEVRDGHAFYYKYPDDAKALGAIDLNPTFTRILRYDTDNISINSPRNEKIFRVITPRRTWILSADNEAEMNEWVGHFQAEQTTDGTTNPTTTTNTSILTSSCGNCTPSRISEKICSVMSNSPRKQSEPPIQAQEQLKESEEHIKELEKEKEEQKTKIQYLEGQLAIQQKETATFARMMSSAPPSNPKDLQEELTKSKTNLVAQLSHVSILSSEVQRLEKELIQARKELKEKETDDLSEMRKRYNFVERKLALLCSKYNESPDDPVTIDMIHSIQSIEETNDYLRERFFIAFVCQIKYQQLIQGNLCSASPSKLYSEAIESRIEPKQYEEWIRAKLGVN